jgi:glycosyltransferase involved in cell wall biosynthesis
MRILIHCPFSSGGLAEHVHYQARAFLRNGVEATVLCSTDFLQGRSLDYPVSRIYRPLQGRAKPRGLWRRAVSLGKKTAIYLAIQWRLALEIWRRKPDWVLLDSYAEYLSPLWVWPHLALARLRGVVYVANIHDPVRDFVVGPKWWHDWSVQLAYAPIRVGVVHQHLTDRSAIPEHVSIVEAPVGVYDLQETAVESEDVRKTWGADKQTVVFLSFGFIRDGKNVDLLIRALTANPEAMLVVMGSAQSSTNKPLSFYRNLAADLGVSGRVVFREEFVPDEALAGYFAAADFIAVTYSGSFHSQSGVLNVAARAGRRVLASAGESPLKTSVLRFQLGEFVEPDNADAVTAGMDRLCRQAKGEVPTPEADWEGYKAYASWDRNVGIIKEAAAAPSRTGGPTGA